MCCLNLLQIEPSCLFLQIAGVQAESIVVYKRERQWGGRRRAAREGKGNNQEPAEKIESHFENQTVKPSGQIAESPLFTAINTQA